ncbi:MAG: MFS transporter [Gemmataceae bacterium]
MNHKAPGMTIKPAKQRLLSPSEWLLLGVLAAVQFTHMVDFVIMMPLGPKLIKQMDLTPGQFGHLVSAYSLSAGIAGIASARFLDRFDRKWVLLVLYSGFGLSTMLCAVANTYELLVTARAVAGAFGGVAASVVLAIVGDAFADARRGTAMGVIMLAFSLATIVGIPIGIELAERYDWHAPFQWLAVASALVLCLGIAVLPPLRRHMSDKHCRDVNLIGLARDPNHLRAFALTAAICLGSFTVYPFLATYLVANVGLKLQQLKTMYIVGGLTTILTVPLVGRLSDKYGKLPMFRILAGMTVVSLLLVTNIPPGVGLPIVIIATTFMMVVTTGRMVPATALITSTAVPAERGGFMSLNAAVQNLIAGFSADLSGWILNQSAHASVHEEAAPLIGFAKVGVIAALFTFSSLWFAGHLRPAVGGDLAPDEPPIPL